MALVVKDRVRETSTTTGTGTITLAGAVTGYQSFSAIGNGNTTYYTIYLQGGSEWEVGIGTYTASGTTLSRDTILASSNGGAAVNFSAGTKDVFVTYPAGRSVYYDTATNVTLNALTLSGGTANGVLYLNGSKVATSGSALTFDGSRLLIGTTTAGVVSGGIRAVHDATEGSPTGFGDEVGWFQRNFNAAQSCAVAIVSGTTSTSSLYFGDKDSINVGSLVYSNSDNSMRFNANGSERMRLNSTSLNIGGNFTSTNNTLQVTGNAAIGYTAAAPTTGLIVAGNVGVGTDSPSFKLSVAANTVSELAIQAVNSGIGNTGYRLQNSLRSWAIFVNDDSSGPLRFYDYTAAAERMRIDSSGNLGLGVTPSASWGTAFSRKAFQFGPVGSVNSISAASTNNQSFFSHNLIDQGSGTYSRINTDWVSQYRQYNGTHTWQTSTTSSGAVTLSDLMTLDASGNLLVGNTNGAYRLTVSSGNAVVVTSGTTGTSGFALFDAATGGNHIGSVTRQGNGIDVAAYDQVSFRTGATSGISSGTERVRIDSAGTVFMRDGTSTTNTNSSRLVVGGTISETVSSTQYLVASQYDIGTAPNEIPLNQYLGSLAYQDASSIAGQVGLSAGTAALPSLVSATDTDTGMWFPAANTLAWSTNGAEKMRLDSSGNLGIGTTAAQGPLEVAVTGATVNQYLTGGTGNNAVTGIFRIGSGTGRGASIQGFRGVSSNVHSLDFYAYNSADVFGMRLDSSGNLGIGTTSPAGKLSVNVDASTQLITFRDSSGRQIWAHEPGGNARPLTIKAQSLTYADDSATRLTVDTSGNVGIGAASPGTKLDVRGETRTGQYQNDPVLRVVSQNTAGPASTALGSLIFNVNANNIVALTGERVAGIQVTSGSDERYTNLGFWTSTVGGQASPRMLLDSSGNLGLGVTPTTVSNNKNLEIGGTNNAAIILSTSSSNAAARNLAIASNFSSYGDLVFLQSNAVGGNPLTAGTQRMTLDASGNLGIGATSPAYRLHVAGTNIYSYVESAANTSFAFQRVTAGTTTPIGVELSADHGATLALVGTFTNHPLVLRANSAEAARITTGRYFKASNDGSYFGSTGTYHELRNTGSSEILYGTNTNANPFGVTLNYTAAAPNGTGNSFLQCVDNVATRAVIRSNGGLANYQANDVNLSDQRTKKDIVAAPSYWDKIKGIEIVLFKYKDQTHDDNNVGVIAQQVEQVAPEFVDQDGWGETPEDGVPLKSIYTSDMYHAAIKALQEAMARIEKLEAEMAALKGA